MITMCICNSMLAAAFLNPIVFDGGRLWMLLPLSLAIAIVYKTLKLDDLKALPVAAFLLWITILGGMVGVAAALYVIIRIFM